VGNPTGIREYKGAAVQSALVGALTNSSLSFSITTSINWPSGAGGKFTIVVDPGTSSEESMLCTSQVGGVITVSTRGYDNTSAVTHAAGAIVVHAPSAVDVSEANTIANFAALTTKSTPVDADIIPGADSASSNATTNFTLAALKAYYKTYFDTLYVVNVASIETEIFMGAY